MLASLLIAFSCVLPGASLQGDKPTPQLPQGLPTTAPGPQAHKWLAVDGKEATPGRIPANTSKGALKLWNEVLSASRIQKAEGVTPPVKSFDLTFDVRIRTAPGTPSKEETVRFRFLDQSKGYLSAEFTTSKRRTDRGPSGDYLRDDKEWVSLQGREDQESRRELDRWVAIARNFVALTQPAAVRVMELKELTVLPDPTTDSDTPKAMRLEFGEGRFLALPNTATYRACTDLRWLEVTSPDFRLFDSGDAGPGRAPIAYRALLGLDKVGRIRLAQFHEDNGGAVRLQGALFVDVRSWKELENGYVLPRDIDTYRSDSTGGHTSFEVQPAMALWLITRAARINPKRPPLQAKDFGPPK
ncbi:MAG: hypothetical protein P1V35_07050 [Planctomycetota bacterium]|nr:hypothetical protein [Planctomycetota bacterium]